MKGMVSLERMLKFCEIPKCIVRLVIGTAAVDKVIMVVAQALLWMVWRSPYHINRSTNTGGSKAQRIQWD